MASILVTLLCMVLGHLVCNVEGTDTQLIPATTASPKLDGRIVNGTKAYAGQFPYLVSLRRKHTDSHFCGGSIISEKWILTAGHCMHRNGQLIVPSTFYVIVGGVKLNDPKVAPRQKRDVEELYVHPKYDDTYLLNDAALVLLTRSLLLTTTYARSIPLTLSTPVPGTECIVSGWGYLTEDGKIASNDLMYLEVPLLARPVCKRLLGKITLMGDGQICAGYTEGKRDACQGDSGGPLACNGKLIGIVSGGKGCARPELPGFYSEIAYYKPWIDKVQSTAGSCCRCACERNNDGRSSSSATSVSFMWPVVIYSLRTLYVSFH